MSLGHVIRGSWVSATVTLKRHVLRTNALSTAVHSTDVVVEPPKAEPDDGLHFSDKIPDASLAEGANTTVASVLPTSGKARTLPGQMISGLAKSLTTTSKLHDACRENWLVAVHVTDVRPRGKVEGDDGLQLTDTLTP